MSSAGTAVAGAIGDQNNGGATGQTTTTVQAPWHTGADAETLGYLQTKGWDKLDAKDAALNAVKSYREAEKHIGAPPDKIIRMPEQNDQAGWRALRERLGAPAKPEEYDFKTTVKFKDGTELDDGFVNAMAKTFHERGVAKQDAGAIAKAVVEFMENAETSDKAESDMKLAQAKDALKANWGSSFNTNMIVARNMFAKLGWSKETVDALEGTVGYDKVMEAMRDLGVRTGEDKFIRGDGAGGGGEGAMTKEQAQYALSQLKNDAEWCNRYFAGDAQAGQKFDTLTRIITGSG